MEPSLALYRRYRPETFAEVIGQEHVTDPLRAALAHNRVNHAYLFSGPRGCGKTTSARILARTLNCAKAPVADPCGECDSCRELARGGPGSIDVIEIDAATHNGVDDARDLREKAFFAPVRDRFKVYIVDEAHMVTAAAFNALLKLVEEPPEHLKFVFATTEPEKVIPTIRSRTHHYPFRLIPPRTLSTYLSELCEREGVRIDAAALPLVVRAGAGSARDTLSVLDQLIGGAGPEGVTYDVATGLLGYTPDSLLDEVVDAFAAGDGRTVFGVLDKVIETGQDPRRFTEDVLRRLRDLVIVAAVPDAPVSGLVDVAEDQAERLVAQAARFGRAELVRAADLLATGLTEMRGATAPRLLLELICARVLLPGAGDPADGLAARLDRLERRVSVGGMPVLSSERSERVEGPVLSSEAPAAPASAERASAPEQVAVAAPPAEAPADLPQAPADEPPREPERPAAAPQQPAAALVEPTTPPAEEAAPVASASAAPAPSGLGLADVRRLWPDVLDRVKTMRRYTWMVLRNESQVVGLDDGTLTVGFRNPGAREAFRTGGSEEILRQALIDLVGADWRIEAINDPSARPGAETEPRVTRPAVPEPDAGPAPSAVPAPNVADQAVAGSPTDPGASGADIGGATETIARARGNIAPTRPAGPSRSAARDDAPDDDADRDDPDADDSGLAGAELLQRELGATVIEDIPHDEQRT